MGLPARSFGLMRCLSALALAVLFALPHNTFAQPALETKQRFVAGLIRFMEALPGTYGDEGARLMPSLDEMQAGLRLWDAGLRAYETAMRQQIQDAGPAVAAALHVPLGAAYLERRRIDDALREFTEAGRLEPERADVLVFRALAYQAANKPSEAADAFRAAWRLEPTDPRTAYLVAQHDLNGARSRDGQNALQALLTFQRQRSNQDERRASPFITTGLLEEPAGNDPVFAPALYADGFALVGAGQYEDALARFREAVAADPLNADAGSKSGAARRGIAELREGRLGSAIRELRIAVGISPDSSEVHRALGTAYRFDEQYEASVEQLEAAIRLSPRDERSWIALADALSEAGRQDSLEQVLRDAIRAIPSSATARWKLGQLLQSRHRDREALLTFEEAAASQPLAGASRVHAVIGRLHASAADFDRAILAFTRRLTADPNDAAAHKELGDMHRRQGRQDLAMVEYLAALLIDPLDAEACAAIGQILLSAGRYAEAVEILQRAVDLKPAYKEARYGLANTLVRLGRMVEGSRELDIVRRLQAEALEEERRAYELSQFKLEADLRFNEGKYEEASALWRQIVDRQPDVALNHAGLGQALAKAQHHEAAIESLMRALALGSGPEIHRSIAEQYDKLGRVEAAQRERELYQQLKEEQLRKLGTRQ